jgi:4-carboxymuconolactone decarboxylase
MEKEEVDRSNMVEFPLTSLCEVLASGESGRFWSQRKGTRRYKMSEPKEQSRAQQLMGDFAPKLAELTDDVLFGDVWAREGLSQRDRCLITVAALIANGNTEQLPGHLNRAKANGISDAELSDVMTHLAFYAGWPRAISAITVAKEVFKK